MTAAAQPDPTFLSRRTIALVAIIGIHVAAIYALATGLGQKLLKELQPPTVVDFLQETPPKETPPPPPTVKLAQEPILDLGPPPDFPVDVGPDSSALQLQAQPTVVDSTPPQLPPAPAVKRVSGGPGKGFPNTDDYYPAASIRLGEQGNTAIQVCVDPNGKLTAEPQVTQSSGSARLDEGAIKLARAGSGHYRATTENGTPVSSCYGYLIKFNLR